MKVLNFGHINSGDPVMHLGFEKYENVLNSDFYFMIGVEVYDKVNNSLYSDKPKIILTLEEPNFCGVRPEHEILNTCDKVLSICPYTSKVFKNRKFVFFPFNQDYIPQQQKKVYDVIYSGSIPSAFISNLINSMLPYNYIFISTTNDSRVNNKNASYHQKINLYSKSKISICHNILFPEPCDIPKYLSFSNSENNEAFKKINECLLPQIKSRVFEAAFSRSLILCAYDYWNVIEHFFEPNKDFIYFYDETDLKEKLNYILNNYEKYTHIIDSAFNVAINNYTTHKFVERFLT